MKREHLEKPQKKLVTTTNCKLLSHQEKLQPSEHQLIYKKAFLFRYVN